MKSNTFNILIQLYIEQILSGAKSYLASHPELGVPLGIFNYKHEPNYEARVNSIKKLGLKGNPFSLHLAETLGVKNILPSFVVLEDEDDPEPPGPGDPSCPPDHITFIFDVPELFGGGTIVICVYNPVDPDNDENSVFALDRVSLSSPNPNLVDFNPSTQLFAEVQSLDQLIPSGISLSGGISVGLDQDAQYPGNAYNMIPSIIRNWQANAYYTADEAGIINFGIYQASNYDANAIQANGNISFADWLTGTTTGISNNQTTKDILPYLNQFNQGSGQAPQRMSEFIGNSCYDPALLGGGPNEDDDNGGIFEEVGFDEG